MPFAALGLKLAQRDSQRWPAISSIDTKYSKRAKEFDTAHIIDGDMIR